ncbi:MAG: radical SAM protein [Armatimonadetes bacterium]|nr:radical SAM protein [Armatimonadota bacterium]
MTFELTGPRPGDTLSVSLYPGAFAIKIGECEVYSFDGEGRPIGASTGDRWLRRGLDNTLVEKRAGTAARGWQPLPPTEADAHVDAIALRMADLHQAVTQGHYRNPQSAIPPPLERAAAWDSRRCRADAARFLRLFHRVPILPPDQYLSLVLQPTEGCRYNRCTFCTLYRDRPFRAKSPEEFRRHLDEVVAYFGRGLARRRSLFLGDANALTLPMADLVPIFAAVQERLPVAPSDLTPAQARRWLSAHPLGFDGIHSFLDVFSGRKKSAAEYAALRRQGLRRVTIGLESGSAPLLQFLRKPERVADAVELVRTLHRAGVSVGVVVMVGAGGDRYAAAHVRETVAVVNAVSLGAADFLYLSEFVEHPGSDYARLAQAERIRALDAAEMAAQADAIRAGLRFPAQAPRVSVYRLSEFVY